MLENSFGLSFFLKTPRNAGNLRNIYLRITVDGIPRETSIKRKWEASRWDQKTERAIGTKEDAKALNFFLDSLLMKVNECKTELLYSGKPVTSEKIMDYILGRLTPRVKVLEEFESHNREMAALIGRGYAEGTLDRFSIPAIIGFITLFGVATRNGILLVSHYQTLHAEGLNLYDTIIQGSKDRLSPILMTALTAGLALIPLAMASDLPGNEIQSPMAKVILGGLLTSTLLNIFIVPIVYYMSNRKNEKNEA